METNIKGEKARWNALLLILIALLLLSFLVSLTFGSYEISIKHVASILLNQIFPFAQPDWTPMASNLVITVRLPRILTAMVVGAALAVSGAVFQGIFQNPLASPYTLGVSNGAGFGAALAILLSAGTIGTQFSAIGFSLVSVGLTYLIGSRSSRQTIGLILAGTVCSSFFAALVSLTKYIADPMDKLPTIVYWLMGSLASSDMLSLGRILPFIVVAIAVVFAYRWRINLLSLGEESAASFGINVKIDRAVLIISGSVLAAASVSLSGVVGWIGLVIPHLGRMLVGPDHRKLIPVCILLGAAYLLIIDDFCRCLIRQEIPLGIVTAIIGTPIFVIFMMRGNENWK